MGYRLPASSIKLCRHRNGRALHRNCFPAAEPTSWTDDRVVIDYSQCGPEGEPRVIYMDQECDYAQTVLAPDCATFAKGLVPAEDFEAPK